MKKNLRKSFEVSGSELSWFEKSGWLDAARGYFSLNSTGNLQETKPPNVSESQ